MAEPGTPRRRAPRVASTIRLGLILDEAEAVLASHDPLLVTFDEIAATAGVSRALLHKHVGDRRGLIDAVQRRVVERLDRWVGHGLERAEDRRAASRALVFGVWSFVEAEDRGWAVLVSTGGLDHPAAHALRARWAGALADGDPTRLVAATFAVGGLLGGIGGWARRDDEPDLVLEAFRTSLGDDR